MNIKQEIEQHSSAEHKIILLWLFTQYHYEKDWTFVATCTFEPQSALPMNRHRVWRPKPAGIALYEHAHRDEMAGRLDINLDAFADAKEAKKAQKHFDALARLLGSEDMQALSDYCLAKALAMRERQAGNINRALSHESGLDGLYRSLPEHLRGW